MVAMAVSFPRSFLSSFVFIFYGNSGEELTASFHDVQDLEQHVMNIQGNLDWVSQRDDYLFANDFYSAVINGMPISIDDAKRFFFLCPEVCNVLDFIEDENALQILREKYPKALCR